MSDPDLGRRLGVLAWTALRFAFVAYALWLVGACFVQRKMLFPAHVVGSGASGGGLPDMDRNWLETPEGRVEWWFFPQASASAEAPAPLVLYAHGNGELIDRQLQEVAAYRELGYHVVLCEYRGYGRSEGSPTQAGLVEDQRRVLDLVLERQEVDGGRLLFHGRSLGTGVVCALALERAPRALVLTSPFTSVADIMAGFWIPSPLVWDPFDNRTALEELGLPTLVIHGDRDRTIPIDHARRLARAIPTIELVELEGVGHNDIPTSSELVWGPVRSFATSQFAEAPTR